MNTPPEADVRSQPAAPAPGIRARPGAEAAAAGKPTEGWAGNSATAICHRNPARACANDPAVIRSGQPKPGAGATVHPLATGSHRRVQADAIPAGKKNAKVAVWSS
jgi:hypothetical protein